MGAAGSAVTDGGSPYDEHVRREFVRLLPGSADVAVPSGAAGPVKTPPTLTLRELLQLSSSAVDFSHLGTLHALNTSRSGRVGLAELLAFARLCFEQQRGCPAHEFKARLQAHCSLHMLREASRSQAHKDGVIDWFVLMLRETSKHQQRHRREGQMEGQVVAGSATAASVDSLASVIDDEEEEDDEPDSPCRGTLQLTHGREQLGAVADDFAGLDAIEMLHRLFHVHRTHGIDFQTFLDMMQQVGEEMGKMDLVDKRYDELVPVMVLRKFVADLLEGSMKLMSELTEPTTDTVTSN